MLMQGQRQKLQQGNLALQESQMNLQKNANMMQQRQGLQQAIQSGQVDLNNPQHQANLVAQFPDAAPAFLSSVQASKTASALAEKDSGAGAASQAEAQTKHYGMLKNATGVISANPTPDVVNSVLTQYSQMTGQPVDETRKLFAQAGNNPAAIKQLADGFAIDADKKMQDQTTQRGQNISSQTQLTTSAAANSAHIQAANISASASRANNAATIAKDYKLGGIDPQTGNFIGMGGDGGSGPMSGIIDALGTNQITMATALSRVPPGMKSGIVAELLKKYPDYDETAIGTRQAANKAFTTGKEGAAMRSIGTAVKHLDMVDGMVDALGNGNLQILNKIGNAYQTQTGNPAPTNFDSAKEIVGQEVVKAIVAGGGGVGERAEAAKALENAKSPAQLRGVIQTYKTIMGAQHESLLQQRDAAGLPRSSLPDYTEAKPAAAPAAAGGGWKYIGPAK